MPRGKAYPVEVRLRVVAEILAGESIARVAQRYDVPRETAQGWWLEDRPVELSIARTRERMVEQLYDTAYECLDGVRASARLLQDPTWARTQNAADLAALVATLGDRTIRMLGGLRPAESNAGVLDGTAVDAPTGATDARPQLPG